MELIRFFAGNGLPTKIKLPMKVAQVAAAVVATIPLLSQVPAVAVESITATHFTRKEQKELNVNIKK